MAAGGIADNTDPVGIHSKRVGTGPQEPDGAFHVFDLRRPGRFHHQAVVRQQADKSSLTEQFTESPDTLRPALAPAAAVYDDDGRAQPARNGRHVKISKEVPISRLSDDDALVDRYAFQKVLYLAFSVQGPYCRSTKYL